MVAAMMLSVFDISEPKSKDGIPLHPGNAEYTGGTIRCALPGHRGANQWYSRHRVQSSEPLHLYPHTTLRKGEGSYSRRRTSLTGKS